MDTTTSQYSNILKAVGQTPQTSEPGEAPKLSLDQQARNYDTFSELMRQGVYLPDLIATIDQLRSEVDALKKGARAEVDSTLFEAMEASVKGVPEVKHARQRMADAKTAVLTDICLKDPRFKEAYDDYRKTVSRSYLDRAEGRPVAGGDAEVREDLGRRASGLFKRR